MPLIRVWEERRDATWRLVGEANDGSWTQSLREQFLLRTDAAPISADRYVSPEVEPEAPGAIEIRLLTLTTIEGDPIAEEVGATPEGWLLLGYDVCDESLLSGLTDCGYSPEELPAGALVELPPEMGSEDFGEYGRAGVPSVMLQVGVVEPARFAAAKAKGEALPSIHSGLFCPHRAHWPKRFRSKAALT